MDFDQGVSAGNNPKLEEMYESLTTITKQLAIIQGFIESKYGQEFTTFCRFSEASSVDTTYTSVMDTSSMHDDHEEYDKMPNLTSEESPSRTLGFVTVPLRQTSSGVSSSNKSQSLTQASRGGSGTGGGTKRERSSIIKEENELETENDNDDMMYPLHNLTDLLEGTGEEDTNEPPEFLELELDPSTLLRGEPPALQPMFASANNESNQQQHCLVNNNNFTSHSYSKRSSSRQSINSFHRYDTDISTSVTTRRASVGSTENNISYKKFDCHICGIKFEFAETLKSHLDSHVGARNVRSSSEDQSSAVGNHLNALSLPRLMPRPAIPTAGSVSLDENDEEPAKLAKSKKKSNSQSTISASSSSSSSLTNPKAIAALKRRKRYNQSRPCALKCPECNLPIRDKSRLIEHLRGHTGERPFECTLCSRSYTRKDVLRTHMVKQHGILQDYQAS